MSKIKRNSTRLVLAAALALLVSAPLALAAEPTRETYVAAVEPICKANTRASEKILKGVKAEVKAGKLAPAAVQFTKAAKALKKTLSQLKAVPQPSADKPKLTKWLTYIRGEAELFERTATKLEAGDKAGAERMSILLTHQANLANDQVLVFEFHYCHAEPSKFT
jgi:predicted outer membrane protein